MMQESLFSYHSKSQQTSSVKASFLKRFFKMTLIILASILGVFFLIYSILVVVTHIMFFDLFI